MKYIGFDREEEAEQWVRKEMALPNAPEFFRAVSAVNDKDEFVCVVVMTNFTARNVDLNLVMKGNGIRPKSLVAMFNELFGLLFGKLRVARVTGLVRGSNARCKKIIERFGFKLEGVMREALPTDDLHVYGMLAGEYKTHDWYRG